MIEKILTFILGKKCKKCNKRGEVERGNWIRGWNNYCDQAAGSPGDYCLACGKINWDISYDEFIRKLPVWCEPYQGEYYK